MFRTIKEITFKISPYCNLNCEYCFQTYDSKTKTNKFNLYDEMVEFICKLPLDDRLEFKMTGGESSLFCDDIRAAYKKLRKIERRVDTRIFCTTISNGTNMEGLLELMDEGVLDPTGCKFSWDGIYSCSRSRKPKNKTYTDEFFNDKVKLIGQSKFKNDLLIRTALTPNTVDNLYESLCFVLDSGCTKWEYYYLTDCDEYTTPEFVEKFKKQIELIAQEYNKRQFNYYNWDTLAFTELVLPKTSNDKVRSIGCRHLGKSLYIAEDGGVYPCGFFVPDSSYCSDCNFKIGDIFSGFSKENIDKFIKEYTAIPMCDWQYCDNMHCFECPALTKYKTGNMKYKLCQACNLRTAEREVFHKYQQIDMDFDKIKNTFMYTKEWSCQKGLPNLEWSNK